MERSTILTIMVDVYTSPTHHIPFRLLINVETPAEQSIFGDFRLSHIFPSLPSTLPRLGLQICTSSIKIALSNVQFGGNIGTTWSAINIASVS